MRCLYFLSLTTCFFGADLTRPPHPVTKYWIPILITLEVTQKRASPLGNDRVRKANIIGIIHSIMLACDCCLGSAVGVITIFCCTHIVPPTRSAKRVSPVARFNQRNSLFNGSVEYTTDQE